MNDGMSNGYETKSKWISSLFIFVGVAIIIYTLFSPLQPDAILALALTTIGLLSTYLTAKMNPHTPASWLKALLIFVTGLIFLFVGISSLTSMGYLVGSFFLLGTLNNLYLAYITRSSNTRYAWLLHALVSGFFAFDILLHTNSITTNIIALYIAINLIFDGFVVLYSGRVVYIRP